MLGTEQPILSHFNEEYRALTTVPRFFALLLTGGPKAGTGQENCSALDNAMYFLNTKITEFCLLIIEWEISVMPLTEIAAIGHSSYCIFYTSMICCISMSLSWVSVHFHPNCVRLTLYSTIDGDHNNRSQLECDCCTPLVPTSFQVIENLNFKARANAVHVVISNSCPDVGR